jgi:hypothetical protein
MSIHETTLGIFDGCSGTRIFRDAGYGDLINQAWFRLGNREPSEIGSRKNQFAGIGLPAVRTSLSALTSTESLSGNGRAKYEIITKAAQNKKPTSITRRYVGRSAL